jgi:hypothetical protein
MYGDEARVVAAFAKWLQARGWTVQAEVDFADVVAQRQATVLYGEAKGRTAAMGLDVDTLYGQLLRRMPTQPQPDAEYAVIVPTEAVTAAERVPRWVRERLNISIYEVREDGEVIER